MTVVALDIERPSILGVGPHRGSDPHPDVLPHADRRTLDDVIAAAWHELAGDRSVSCPVCSGRMQPRYGAGSSAVGGRCTDCRSSLG